MLTNELIPEYNTIMAYAIPLDKLTFKFSDIKSSLVISGCTAYLMWSPSLQCNVDNALFVTVPTISKNISSISVKLKLDCAGLQVILEWNCVYYSGTVYTTVERFILQWNGLNYSGKVYTTVERFILL
jgi:hypothetical protein